MGYDCVRFTHVLFDSWYSKKIKKIKNEQKWIDAQTLHHKVSARWQCRCDRLMTRGRLCAARITPRMYFDEPIIFLNSWSRGAFESTKNRRNIERSSCHRDQCVFSRAAIVDNLITPKSRVISTRHYNKNRDNGFFYVQRNRDTSFICKRW